jgi:hypothetical protein
MDAALRNSLWNALFDCYWSDIGRRIESFRFPPNKEPIVAAIWGDHLKRRLDDREMGSWRQTYTAIAEHFSKCPWYEFYDLIEFVLRVDDELERSRDFVTRVNKVLEREMSAYRCVGGEIVEMTSNQEIEEIEGALAESPDNVKEHLSRALALLSDRKSPDYRNSIKESISPVEAICIAVTNDEKATLGQALGQLEKRGIDLHPALRGAFERLYGYASAAHGIRHALTERTDLDFADAKFMLVSCSAFVNYLRSKSASSTA